MEKKTLNTDSVLLARLKKGDGNAFVEIYEKYHKTLFVIAHKYHGFTEEESQDLVHDFFIKFWELEKFKSITYVNENAENTALRNFFYVCFDNECKKRHKKEKSRKSALKVVKLEYENDPGVENSPYEHYEIKALKQEIDMAMQKLQKWAPKAAEAFILLVVLNKSRREASLELGISQNSVRNMAFRAVQKMRIELKKLRPALQK